jgi:TPR repeat protein
VYHSAVKSLVVGSLLLVVCGPAHADFFAGQEAYERGDYETARREWLPLAQSGDAETEYRIARMIHYDQLEGEDAEAARWYRMAADRGHAAAQNNLGLLHEQGRGVEADPAAAVAWYRRAAEQNLVAAQVNLARCYDQGIGLAENPEAAAEWYARAASQQHAASQFRLGEMYAAGRGVPQDSKKAAKWLRRAEKNGHAGASQALDEIDFRRFERETAAWAAASLPPVEAPPEAVEPARPSTDGSEPVTEEPPPAALADLRARAEQGDTDAQFALGRAYATGGNDKPDMEEASRWYRAAAESGHVMAAYTLGFMYYRGRGVSQDLVEAWRWFASASEGGAGDARNWLAEVESKLSKKQRVEGARLRAAGGTDSRGERRRAACRRASAASGCVGSTSAAARSYSSAAPARSSRLSARAARSYASEP